MDEFYRAFIDSNKAFYAKHLPRFDTSIKYEIYFGEYTEGDILGEMRMVWQELGGQSVPQLCVFDDAWATLKRFSDLLDILAQRDNQNITPVQFVGILKSLGFRDDTTYEEPE